MIFWGTPVNISYFYYILYETVLNLASLSIFLNSELTSINLKILYLLKSNVEDIFQR